MWGMSWDIQLWLLLRVLALFMNLVWMGMSERVMRPKRNPHHPMVVWSCMASRIGVVILGRRRLVGCLHCWR